MTYAARVTFTDHASTVVDVQTEADPDTGEGQEEAYEKAEDQLPGGLCHHRALERTIAHVDEVTPCIKVTRCTSSMATCGVGSVLRQTAWSQKRGRTCRRDRA